MTATASRNPRILTEVANFLDKVENDFDVPNPLAEQAGKLATKLRTRYHLGSANLDPSKKAKRRRKAKAKTAVRRAA